MAYWTEEEKDRAAEMRARGVSWLDVAVAMGRSVESVRGALRWRGVGTPRVSTPERRVSSATTRALHDQVGGGMDTGSLGQENTPNGHGRQDPVVPPPPPKEAFLDQQGPLVNEGIPAPQKSQEVRLPPPASTGPEAAFEIEEEHDLRGWQDYKPRPAMAICQPGRVTPADVRRRVIIGDVHCKYQDRSAEAVGLSIIREFAPHSIWQIGDLLDCEAISDFGQQRLAWDTLAAEQYEANLFLDRVQDAAPNASMVILGGNHDDPGPEGRPGKYAAKHSEQGLGICNTPVELYIEPREYNRHGQIELRGATYIRVAKQPFRDGLSAMFHGIGWEAAGYAKLIADRYIPANCHGVHVLYGGHMHGLASASGVAGGIYQCVGWWGDRKHEVVTYKKKKGIPADWHNAIVLEESSEHSVHYQVVRIVNGAALFGGKIYAAKAA